MAILRQGALMHHRPTTVFIDTMALIHNFQEVLRLASPGSPVAPVVKSDAYGHGGPQETHGGHGLDHPLHGPGPVQQVLERV